MAMATANLKAYELQTASINGLQVFATGRWNGDDYVDQDLDEMVSAFPEVGFRPTIKAGHQDGQENAAAAMEVFGAPALGYVSRLYRQGQILYADIIDIPRRFADLIKAGAYRRVSSEIYWNYKDGSKSWPRVLKAVAFLGAEIPAITSLKEVEALYRRNGGGGLYAYDERKNEFRVYDGMNEGRAPMQIQNGNAVRAYFEGSTRTEDGLAADRAIREYQKATGEKDYRKARDAVRDEMKNVAPRQERKPHKADDTEAARRYFLTGSLHGDDSLAAHRAIEKRRAKTGEDYKTAHYALAREYAVQGNETPRVQFSNFVLNFPRTATGIDFPGVIDTVRSSPDLVSLARAAADEAIQAWIETAIALLGGVTSQNYLLARRNVLAAHPSVAAAYSNGAALDESAIREIVPSLTR